MKIDASVPGRVFEMAAQQGFSRGSYIPLNPPAGEYRAAYQKYLEKGYQADMKYLANIPVKFSPQLIGENCQSMFVFAYPYSQTETEQAIKKALYRVARYAWGKDYHEILRKKLHKIFADLEDVLPQARIVCDTTPLPERYYARQANLGFIGRNGMLIDQDEGSYFLLGFALLPLETSFGDKKTGIGYRTRGGKIEINEFNIDNEWNKTISKDTDLHCAACNACVDNCPGQALQGDGMLDARRCFSYWSIESRSQKISFVLKNRGRGKKKTKRWIFGCDICQEVCPYNRQAHNASGFVDENFAPSQASLALSRGRLDEMGSLKGTAFARAGKERLRRNLTYAENQTENGRDETNKKIKS